jgi:hypothetical protein
MYLLDVILSCPVQHINGRPNSALKKVLERMELDHFELTVLNSTFDFLVRPQAHLPVNLSMQLA